MQRSIDFDNAEHEFFLEFLIPGFFLDISKKTQGQKNSRNFSKKLKQIIWKLNILPTKINFFFFQKLINLFDLALKFVQTVAFLLNKA